MKCERLVFQMHCSGEGVVLTASAKEFDELLGFIAANANHETNRRRQKRLSAAFDVLTEALQSTESADAFTMAVAIGIR